MGVVHSTTGSTALPLEVRGSSIAEVHTSIVGKSVPAVHGRRREDTCRIGVEEIFVCDFDLCEEREALVVIEAVKATFLAGESTLGRGCYTPFQNGTIQTVPVTLFYSVFVKITFRRTVTA